MSKKAKTFSSLLKSNQKVISKIYYKYIFLIIIFGTILVGILFYKLDAHIVLFGDTPSALGEYVKTVATVLGGALVVLGLWINNRRVAEQTRQNNIAEKGQINTRFKDAATLLGSENVSSILSGVYALHQIALESSVGDEIQKGYVRIIHDILCAYVRENTETIVKEDDGREWRVNSKPTIVIQTIIKVLFKNNEFIYSDIMTDLSNCIFEDIDLDNAYIAHVDFSKTKFIRSTAKDCSLLSCYLENTFIDDTDFSESSFEKVIFDNSHIKNTTFVKAKFIECDLWDTILFNTTFEKAKLRNVDFKNSIFEDNVDFSDTVLQGYLEEEIKSKSDILTKI
ncbi:MAG: pentapeptide repeat-containing protein [Dysgonomonas sp.]